ncbi:Ubiquitin--protein ligase [Handroanthus impetiginosus]|uniref:Ubiquitin--protein ligase n=1 Tax=Handroanthus impetiginosus TaxID=429701 RepID=A0A2G9GLR8_9LAMI|nr:Ubiquitin--protein ligase [Handroanthus impetiginosus]
MIYCSSHMDSEASFSPKKLVECRICQDEDVDSNVETPCSCSGSLKYAHRKCIQRWCDEKGDTVCEICHQHFKPGYTAPPPIVNIEGLPMNSRRNWHIARRELNNSHIIAMVSTDPSFQDPEYDEHAVYASRSTTSCHSAVIIFMFLLILRHTLPVIASQAEHYSFPLITLLMLRVAAIVLPVCIILKAVISILHRGRQQ